MSEGHATSAAASSGPARPGRRREEEARPRRQFALITLTALAIFFGLRWLPTGTNLSHMDFRVDAKNAIEFCDPLNPQFIPVVEQRSPVVMTIATGERPAAGVEATCIVTLRTASGKPLAPEDLLVAHTRKLHLLTVDPTLTDYQHVHPQPGKDKGTWIFRFTPRASGAYRVFADFTPAATGRGLYASADIDVAPAGEVPGVGATSAIHSGVAPGHASYRFGLETALSPIRAGQTVDLKFTVRHEDGAEVPLQPVMGAFAHLVAFDQARSGFAHLHPAETDLNAPPDRRHPVLNFKLTIPKAGRYVVWSQINLAGEEVFVPFWIEVT